MDMFECGWWWLLDLVFWGRRWGRGMRCWRKSVLFDITCGLTRSKGIVLAAGLVSMRHGGSRLPGSYHGTTVVLGSMSHHILEFQVTVYCCIFQGCSGEFKVGITMSGTPDENGVDHWSCVDEFPEHLKKYGRDVFFFAPSETHISTCFNPRKSLLITWQILVPALQDLGEI